MQDLTTIREHVLLGPAVAERLDDLATLRLEIFEEYPYLYRGRRTDELAYLRSYAEKPDACAILACDGDAVVGAATGMPLIHEDAQLLGAFSECDLSLTEIYYVGELLFLPAYRNCSLGQRLLAQMESRVRSFGRYRKLTCATIERPADHPLRPTDYIPITRFLARTGFEHLPGVVTHFEWRETDGVKRDHAMQFWIKELTGKFSGQEI